MTTQNEPNQTGTPSTAGSPHSPAQTTPPATPTLDEVIADRDKWKALSRTNEDRWNTTSTELQQLKAAKDAELEAARTEGRASALGEVSTELVTAELRLQAASAGAELPDLQFLDLARFSGDDSRPNTDAVTAFIESLPKPQSGTGFPHLAGAGHNREASGSFASTNPAELADYIAGGSFL